MLKSNSLFILITVVSAVYSTDHYSFATILGHFEAIDSAFNALATKVVDWDASRAGALSIISSLTTLSARIDSYNIEATTEPTLDSGDSHVLVSFIADTLFISVNHTANALATRKPEFVTIGLVSNILYGLQLVHDSTNNYDEAVINLITPELVGEFKGQIINLSEDLGFAIVVYSS
ncbi:hypothetical protein K461DRAFT_268687 [Myriangium duriaei CBS 260.36]|uniref:Uncharacterized protein n=1 Tax=Myriangium duriaei CBS 260.36 TaxID=1168546 RepID=A0A9P4MH26_9PEZI|nr:hypothetical protein K461DRAFT_268687 [Myriangium duriaei CBS 260.36]